MAWLDALSTHPIFTLPPDDASPPPPLSSHPSLAQLPRPASPGAQPILGHSLNGRISHSASSRSLFGLNSPNSSINKRASSSRLNASTAAKVNGAPSEAEGAVKGGRKSRMVIVRGTEVVVAVGKELRMASLADVKAKCHDDTLDDEAEVGEYKVLSTPTINFEIQQLMLNPTSKLLAVVGAHSVVVVVLPRKGWANSVGKTLECRSLPIGKFHHALPGSPLVAQVLWHPWGEHASSLLVLTVDSTLREYNVSEDVEEPTQTVSLARSKNGSGGGRGGFSAEDRDASRAVGFCIGEGKGDWGPLTLYALMRNGDVVSLCPFLPKKASIPPSYVRSLSAFVSAKMDFLAAADAATSALTRFDPSASTSSALATPSKALSRSTFTSASPASTRTPPSLSKRYALQQQYVNSLVRQITAASSKPASSSLDPDALDGAEADVDPDQPVRVILPSRSDFTPSLQGPFLLQPAPAELDNGADCRACDIAYLQYSPPNTSTGEKDESEQGSGLGVIAVAYSDGKVDLCLEVEKIEARWAAENDALVIARPRRRGYGLDDASDEEDEEAGLNALPALAVYETIDLGLAEELNPTRAEKGEKVVAEALSDNHTTLVRDPLYPDTLYVHHALGAHCLLLEPWLADLAAATNEAEEKVGGEAKLQGEVEKTLKGQAATEVLWVLKTRSSTAFEEPVPPVVGLQVVNDVYLGYSLLLLTSSLQLAGIELSLRIDSSDLALHSASATSSAPSADPPAYVSLLNTPFTVPAILSSSRPATRLGPTPGGSKELTITPDTLRQLGKHVSTVQTSVRELVSAADEVQHRLELQMKELSRQLGKLAELKQLRVDLGKSVAASSAADETSAEARLRRAEQTQQQLVERADRVLQRLMEAHQPEVSTYERRWFDELGRLEVQVHGAVDEDRATAATSLETRACRVEAQFEALRPALEEMKRREGAKQAAGGANGAPGTPSGKSGLGQAQLTALERKLADEAKLIADAKRKVERLTGALGGLSL
ncbi:hypothetical protein JCM8097_009196 [Rhodosporidiobolus ruineniae]